MWKKIVKIPQSIAFLGGAYLISNDFKCYFSLFSEILCVKDINNDSYNNNKKP